MESFGIGIAGLGTAGLATLGAFGLAFRQHRRRREKAAAAKAIAPRPRSTADRLEALAAAQADLALRLDTLATQGGAPEERLQAMAGQLLGLVRDKNATLETALAGLDQLRARMRALEQMGEPAEARALLETLQGRIDEVQAAQAAGTAALEAKLGTLAAPGADNATALAERLVKLQESRDQGSDAVIARLGQLETRFGALEAGREALKRLEGRIEALQAEGLAAKKEIAGLKAETGGPVKDLAEQLAKLHAQKEALAGQLVARIGALETELRGRDPQPVLDRLAERLDALRAADAALGDRLAALETPAETPYAAIAAQLTELYAQKDAGIEAMLGRLAPLEGKIADLETALAARDPQMLLDRFAERLEAVQGRVAAIEAGGETPFSEIADQLTRLYAQKDATVETVFARLAPLEAQLAEIAARDPQALLDRFAERLEAMRTRVTALETEENPFGEISEQLTRLYAQKDATVETVFARLAPLEAQLAEIVARDPQAALAGVEARLEGLGDRLMAIEDNPFAELAEKLTQIHAQKDAAVETVFARLSPIETKLAEVERALHERDPRALLDRFAERLEGMQGRLATLEEAENPFGEISDQLTRLYAQKDATVETVFARLAPLEARLGEMEKGLAERDPRALLDRFAERLEAMQGRLAALEGAENPFGEISAQLTRLYAQKDATVETVFARLAPLEARLAEIDARDPQTALAGIEARLEGLRERLGAIEAGEGAFGEIAGQLTRLHAQKDAAVEAVFARLAPLEARLTEMERGVERGLERLGPLEAQMESKLAERDPRPAIEGLRERLEGLQRSQAETAAAIAALQDADGGALGEVADQLTRLYAQKDAGIAALLTRLQPLEARLAVLEARPSWDPEAEEARAESQAVAVRLIAGLAAAEQTALFADRLNQLEASLPKAGEKARAGDLDSIWSLPRVVSLHQA